MMEVSPPTALIVDDNYFNRDLYALALQHVGYKVVHAENGREAINTLENQKFNLLILDLAMPELDGMGVIREIREEQIPHAMSIVVMTANPHMATNELDADVDFVVYKPIDINEFSMLAARLTKRHVGASNTSSL